MFKKLLSNLPFNPSLIGEVSFYAKRMHGEAAMRRSGFIILVLAILVQMFAIISPPESTLAESNNDILRGGFSSKEQAVNYCRANTQGFAGVLLYHGLTCDDVARSTIKTLKSTDYNRSLRSMGRVPQGQTIARTGKPTNESTLNIAGTNYYMRNLWAWDSRSYSTYKMLAMKNVFGQDVMIMYNCGNIVTVGHYSPPPPKPAPAPAPTPVPAPAPTPTPAPVTPPIQKPEPPKDVCSNIEGIQTTLAECDVCPNVPGDQNNTNQCYPCPEAKKDNAVTACLKMHKTASNQTQNIEKADGTIAKANDIIEYTLTTTNEGNQAVQDFIVEENMSDVLEYADIVNLHGGDMDDNHVVSWPKQTIAANASLTKKISVKIKDPIPQTPISSSDPGSFDMNMANVYYGNTVNIKLPPNITKTTELAVQTLPETGPGTTIALSFAVTVFVAYFFARSRLLAKELDIVKTDFTSTGGI